LLFKAVIKDLECLRKSFWVAFRDDRTECHTADTLIYIQADLGLFTNLLHKAIAGADAKAYQTLGYETHDLYLVVTALKPLDIA
jgi:hypothetical protein